MLFAEDACSKAVNQVPYFMVRPAPAAEEETFSPCISRVRAHLPAPAQEQGGHRHCVRGPP